MSQNQSGDRRRSLECDRLFSAGLCMSATAILAAHVPAAAALFEPRGASQAVAPFICLGAALGAVVAMRVAAGGGRRTVAGLAVVAGAALLALAVPFARQTLMTFIAGATPAWTAGSVALIAFGVNASFAVQETKPTPAHARTSAIITVGALCMAATDGSGVFSGILAAMGLLFFTIYRVPARG